MTRKQAEIGILKRIVYKDARFANNPIQALMRVIVVKPIQALRRLPVKICYGAP
jgi:hypothetical protein